MKRHSQRGIALVVTLIMLSVITLLAVAFLAISRRNKESVGTSQSQTDARIMSDAALARAEADMIAKMFGTNNLPDLKNIDLTVSRSYVNASGFTGGAVPEDPANVNYEHYAPNLPGKLFGDDIVRNIGNLSRDPRVPVYIVTNALFPNALDFRFYLDLNRNGMYDTNGLQPLIDDLGNVVGSAELTGDPEWIGVLERPDKPHSGTNRFIGRYCYLVMPTGKALDLNFIHNQAKLLSTNADGYLRNQGYGSWELNLAGFLADLNTNYWNTNVTGLKYFYDTNSPASSVGYAFDDARDLLRFRYSPTRVSSGGDYNNLMSAQTYYFPTVPSDFVTDGIDNYANGPLVTANFFDEGLAWPPANLDTVTTPWSGSDNTNSFYSLQDELFDPNKIVPSTDAVGFVGRLTQASKAVNSYDRFTFYRLLSQMAVDSAPERDKKINVNYKDQVNFVRWTNSVEFFTNAALKLLSVHYGRTLTNINIPVYNSDPLARTNYAPEIHRLLQVSANIYDATTTNTYPSVFRPLFASEVTNGVTNVYIYDFMDQNAEAIPTNVWSRLPKVASDPTLVNDDVIFGVPFVVGAKRGMPNMNEVSLQTLVKVSRQMDVRKPLKTDFWKRGVSAGWETNLIYTIGLKHMIGVEAWNSYLTAYPRPVTLMASNQLIVNLTNQFGTTVCVTNATAGGKLPATWTSGGVFPKTTSNSVTLANFTWPQMGFRLPIANEITNLLSSQFILPGSLPNGFYQEAVSSSWESNNNHGLYFYVPEWGLQMTNRLRYMLVDDGKIIDFVNTGDMVVMNSLYEDLNKGDQPPFTFWDTHHSDSSTGNSINKSVTVGMANQLNVALKGASDDVWANYGNSLQDKDCAIEAFNAFLFGPPTGQPNTGSSCKLITKATNSVIWQVPFTPSWYLSYSNCWQVNDPLIHYTVSDLNFVGGLQGLTSKQFNDFSFITNSNLGKTNEAYSPWGGNPNNTTPGVHDFDFKLKDSLVKQSSDWDFPTNLFPSIGYLGRVHRGTPWQTVYLKADVSPLKDWLEWGGSGYTNMYLGNVSIGSYTHPTNDWRVIDMFTTAPNDNASRGLLSVNQKGLAAWSAALSGVIVLSNYLSDAAVQPPTGSPGFAPEVIRPGSPQLLTIYSAITNWGSNGFSHIGDVLTVPQLTTQSPFLTNTTAQLKYGISDAAYERIPQQILSLLKLGDPRFVIYAWGQSLKPAENSIVFNPPSDRPELQNICTNYQITGEVVTRAVVRIEQRVDAANKTNYQGVIESYNILPGE